MNILSKMPERLKELMFDKGVNAPTLAKEIGIRSNTVTRYLQGVLQPKLDVLLRLVDYFHCSADFLLGLNEYPQYEENFLPSPPFNECFAAALKTCKVSQYALQKATDISWANFHFWLKGLRQPYADSVIRIANGLDISVDYLLGRVR